MDNCRISAIDESCRRVLLLSSLIALGSISLVAGAARADNCEPPSAAAITGTTGFSGSQNCQTGPQIYISAPSYGVACDGITNDSNNAQNALNAASARGGAVVVFPATGAACRLPRGIRVPTGVSIEGTAELNWPGPFSNVESEWTNKGTWLKCEDKINPCITIDGAGSHITAINFWYDQPTPNANKFCGIPCKYTYSWTPVTYPYTIEVGEHANFNHLSDIAIINASHCIDWEGPNSGVAGIYSSMQNLKLGCFDRGIRFSKIDATMYASNIRHDIWWYRGSSDVLGYTEGQRNRIDWDVQYLANLQADGLEFVNSAIAIKFTDATVNSGFGKMTFAASELQLSNISFNEVCQAIAVADTMTRVSARLANVIAYTDTITSSAEQCAGVTHSLFDLSSNNVYVRMHNLSVGFAQTVATVGGGASGYLGFSGIRVQRYSAFAAGAPALAAAPGAQIAIADTDFGNIVGARGAGEVISGSRQPSTIILPTSCAGLPTGTLYNKAGSPAICP
jgi:hypothetical protein